MHFFQVAEPSDHPPMSAPMSQVHCGLGTDYHDIVARETFDHAGHTDSHMFDDKIFAVDEHTADRCEDVSGIPTTPSHVVPVPSEPFTAPTVPYLEPHAG